MYPYSDSKCRLALLDAVPFPYLNFLLLYNRKTTSQKRKPTLMPCRAPSLCGGRNQSLSLRGFNAPKSSQ